VQVERGGQLNTRSAQVELCIPSQIVGHFPVLPGPPGVSAPRLALPAQRPVFPHSLEPLGR
jgi:hypothetical protein